MCNLRLLISLFLYNFKYWFIKQYLVKTSFVTSSFKHKTWLQPYVLRLTIPIFFSKALSKAYLNYFVTLLCMQWKINMSNRDYCQFQLKLKTRTQDVWLIVFVPWPCIDRAKLGSSVHLALCLSVLKS